MNTTKEQAIATMNELHRTIPYTDYCTVIDGLQDIETLRDRDEKLEELWAEFGDVPMNPETECIEEPFMGWGAGIHREEIWHWFDARHSKGVAYLLYGGAEDYVPETKRLYELSKLCIYCDAEHCAFNPKGICKFPLVSGEAPVMDDDGCHSFCYTEEET